MTSRSQPSQKTSRGRQKIEIRRRDSIDDRRVTFTKRRTGLFEKAAELCVLCGARVVIITFSEGRKAFCFAHPDTDALLEEYLSGRCGGIFGGGGGYPINLADVYAHATNESERRFRETTRQLGVEKAGHKPTHERQSVQLHWWEQRIEDLGSEELEFFHDSLEKLVNGVAVKLDEVTKRESALHQSLVGLGNDNVGGKDWFVEGSSHMWPDDMF
ncbi:hypothetical protein MLD38_021951 [Melastoma candidum]|uniref:Uncharacterized protein n=1 Tax=Melastoma candidum TaxID=119954 RepID=A0ACB9QKM8_9MYRT|nr:hypothetical protein MLD38_021951 [Melastoma candidum]